MSVVIRLIGRPEIRDSTGQPVRIRGHKPWAVLARVALAERPVSRQQLAAELFPDADDPLGSLRWCLAELRRGVGAGDAFGGDPVVANLPADAHLDTAALLDGTFDRFDDLGELLQGVHPKAAPGFESWLLVERERVAGLVDAKLRQAVLRALSLGDHERATRLAQVGVTRSPFDESAHVLFVRALVAAGSAAATDHVAATEELFRTELGAPPSPALRSALRLTVAGPAPGVSARSTATALLDAGLAALDAGAVDAGMECLRRAAAEAERADDNQLHAKTLLELGTALVHAVRGYDDEGAVLLRQAADLGTGASDPALAAQALRELGYVDALVGRRRTAAAYLDEATRLASGDTRLMAGISAVVGFNLSEWGNHRGAIERYAAAVDLARSAGMPRRAAWALGLGARAQLLAGEPDRAEAWLKECVDVVDGEQWVAFRPWPLALLGEIRLDAGDDPAAVRSDLEEAFVLSCQLGDPCWEGSSARVLALTHAAEGDFGQALGWIGDARRRATRETDSYAGMEASILATDAELSVRADDPVRAEAAARSLLTLAARTQQDGFLAIALELLRLDGDAARATGPLPAR